VGTPKFQNIYSFVSTSLIGPSQQQKKIQALDGLKIDIL
jgi:hypothetical protein